MSTNLFHYKTANCRFHTSTLIICFKVTFIHSTLGPSCTINIQIQGRIQDLREGGGSALNQVRNTEVVVVWKGYPPSLIESPVRMYMGVLWFKPRPPRIPFRSYSTSCKSWLILLKFKMAASIWAWKLCPFVLALDSAKLDKHSF